MYYGLAYYTELNIPRVREFRKKYDPWHSLIKDHLSIIFPIPESIGIEKLIRHIDKISREFHPFDIHIKDFSLTWDYFLFLKLQEGREEVVRLHHRMYSGMLKPHLRKDILFEPHIALGFFAKGEYDPVSPAALEKDEERLHGAEEELTEINIDQWRTVDCLTLVGMDEELTGSFDLMDFYLK